MRLVFVQCAHPFIAFAGISLPIAPVLSPTITAALRRSGTTEMILPRPGFDFADMGQNGYPLHCPLGIWYSCRVDTTRHPLAGLDYPRTFQAMDERFRDDEACRQYIRRLRWPKGFTCLHCGEVGEPMGDGGRMIGTHQGGVRHQHLNYYLDEFTFRLGAGPAASACWARRWKSSPRAFDLRRDRQASGFQRLPD